MLLYVYENLILNIVGGKIAYNYFVITIIIKTSILELTNISHRYIIFDTWFCERRRTHHRGNYNWWMCVAILFYVFIDKHCIFENLIDTSAFSTMIVCRFQSFSNADTLKFDDDVKSMHIGFVILIIVRDKIFNVTRM